MDLHTAGASQQVLTRGGRYSTWWRFTFFNKAYIFRPHLSWNANRNHCIQVRRWRLVKRGGAQSKNHRVGHENSNGPIFVVIPNSYTHPGCYCREWDALQALACSALLWLHKSTLSEPLTMMLFLISRICRVCTRVRFHGHFYFIVHKNKWFWFVL